MRPVELILVRHTRPDVAEGLCYGVTELEPAPSFDEEAARVIEALPDAGRLVTSPLKRARCLAERIGEARGLVPVVDARLREMDFGAWEGRPWASLPRAELDAWAANRLHARPHGGESVHMLRERVAEALRDHQRSAQPLIAITHAGVIRAARALHGVPNAWESPIGFGEFIRLPATG